MNLARNIATTFLTRIGSVLLALIASVIVARALGPEGRGVFALILLIPDFVKTFGLFGFDQSNTVFAGLEPNSNRTLVWQSALMGTLVGGLTIASAGVFFVLDAPGFGSKLQGPHWIYLLALTTVPAALIADYWTALLRGMNRILVTNAIEAMRKVAWVFLVVLLVALLRFDIVGAVWADWLMNFGTVVFLIFLLKDAGAWGKPSFDAAQFKRNAKFALPAWVGGVLSYLNYRVDQFIIAAMLPAKELGYYVIAVGLAERIWMPTGAVATSLLPHLTNSPEPDPALSAKIARHVFMITGSICLVIAIFAELVIRILYSSEFVPAASPLRWLLPAIFILSGPKVLVAEILARKKVAATVWMSAGAAVINVAANFALVPRWGITGSAIASSISYSFLAVGLTWLFLRVSGLSWSCMLPRRSDFNIYTRYLRLRWPRLTGAPVPKD